MGAWVDTKLWSYWRLLQNSQVRGGDQRLVGRYPSGSGRFHKLLGTGQAELGSGHMTLSTGTLW